MNATQGALFNTHEAPLTSQCRFPQLGPSSAYRYGCRCPRCLYYKQQGLSPHCRAEGCDNLRLKGRRYCDEHRPPTPKASVRKEAQCTLCASTFGWYESVLQANVRTQLQDFYRQVCNGCRQRYMGAIKHHHLDTKWALRLVTAERCDICKGRFPVDQHGRTTCIVDHDHNCCPNGTSCGECIRGILCNGCNTRLGTLENVMRTDLNSLLDYLKEAGTTLTFNP